MTGELPSGVTVQYSNNGKTNAGTYTVTANLSGTGYEPLRLTATLTIDPVPIDKSFYFISRAFLYDGQNHKIEIDSLSGASSYTITYKCLNASGTNVFASPGVYEIEATVKLDANHLTKKTATLTIFREATASVDSSKTPLTINENLTWDQLKNALANGNFVVKHYSGSYDVPNVDDPRPANLLDASFEGHSSGYFFASDGQEAWQHSYSLNSSDESNYYEYYKIDGSNIIHLDTYYGYAYKFPKVAFKETVVDIFASDALVALTKGDDGEILPGVNGDTQVDVGTPFIENGVLTVLMEHPTTLGSGDTRYFYEIYKYSNIGNTSINIPNDFVPSQSYINNKIGVDDFYLNGVKYGTVMFGTATNYKHYYTAQLYVNYHRAVFLEPGSYVVLPGIYDRVVQAIIYTKSSYAYNTNQSPYTFKLHVNSSGEYQGEYSDYEDLSKLDISGFTNKGGHIQYYDDWHS